MFVLILLTCLSDGTGCYKHLEAEGLGMSECHVVAPRIAAQWQTEHPGQRVQKMICDDHRRVPFHLGRNQA